MARFAVIGSAFLSMTGEIDTEARSRMHEGRVWPSFGGTGLNLAVDLVTAGNEVSFLTAVPDNHLHQLIIDAVRQAGIAVYAEYEANGVAAGESCHYERNGTLWSGVSAPVISRTLFRDRLLANVIDPADEVVIEAGLHPQALVAAIGRAAMQRKRTWLIGATEFVVGASVMAALDAGLKIAGLFVKDKEYEAAFEAVRASRRYGLVSDIYEIAYLIDGYVIHTRDQVASCAVWGEERRPIVEQNRPAALRGEKIGWVEAPGRHIALVLDQLGRGATMAIAAETAGVELERQKVERQGRAWSSDALEERIKALTHDALTGLANRHSLASYLKRLDDDAPIAVMMIDLDKFKSINDTFGHDTGDHVLREMGKLLGGAVRNRERPFRMGGEELLVIMPDTDLDAARGAAERIRRLIEAQPFQHGQVTATIGVVVGRVEQMNEIMHKADEALYAGKQAGRNRVVCAELGQVIDSLAPAGG